MLLNKVRCEKKLNNKITMHKEQREAANDKTYKKSTKKGADTKEWGERKYTGYVANVYSKHSEHIFLYTLYTYKHCKT